MKLSEIITLCVAVLAIISSIVSIFINVYLKQGVDVKLTQYNLTNEEQNRIIKNLFDLEDYLDQLIDKYKIQANVNDLPNKLSSDEKLAINKYISQIDVGLAKIFIFMPDKEYETIAADWPLEPRKLSEIRGHLLLLLRKTQYPETKFNQEKDIKNLQKLK